MELKRLVVNGRPSMGLKYDKDDFIKMKDVYKQWITLNKVLTELGARSLNVPDLLSEGLFAYLYGCYRTNGKLNSYGYDVYDDINKVGIQIKSCSIDEDLTSFGPKTHWDRIYFMKFHPLSADGLVEIFDITDFDIENIVLCKEKNETFKDQQLQNRRPRFSIQKELIDKYSIKPIRVVKLLED